MRFTIRDLLWLTVVVAIVCAWWVDRVRLTHHPKYRLMPNPAAPATIPPKK